MFNKRIFFLFSTRNLLTKYFNDGTISVSDHEMFITTEFAFYCEGLRYKFKRMYCDDNSFQKHAQWIDYFVGKNVFWSDIEYFIKPFTNSLKFENCGIERLYQPFVEFEWLSHDQLPTDTLKDMILSE